MDTNLDARRARQEAQALRAQRMQDKILEHLEAKLDSGEINATELKTAVDLLRANGWDFDVANQATTLGDKLTRKIKYDDDIHNETAMKVVR